MDESQIVRENRPDPERGTNLRAFAARLLRGLGAGVLVASLSVFLFQNWSEVGDLGRFTLLLGQTVLLMLAGFASGRWLHEPRGARVFVCIALVAVVVNFAVLGGLLWSQYGSVAARAAPQALVWQAASGGWALAATAVAALVLYGVCRIGFVVLARPSARILTGLYLGSCTILLVPVRDAGAVALLAAAALVLSTVVGRRLLPGDPGLRTPEGLFALALPLIPVGVLIGRGLLFYPGILLTSAVATTAAWALLRELSLHAPAGPARHALEATNAVAALPVAFAWATLAVDQAGFGYAAWLPICGLVGGGLCIELATRAARGRDLYRLTGAAAIALTTAANVLMFDGVLTASVALATGVAVMAWACAERRVWLLPPAAVACLSGVAELVTRAVGALELGAWGWLALIGTAAVLAGSVVERLGPRWLALWRSAAATE